MALCKTVVFKGIVVPASYIVVVAPTIHPGNTEISFSVQFASKEGAPTFDTANYACAYSLEGANPVDQAYLYLKSLPEFADAIDC